MRYPAAAAVGLIAATTTAVAGGPELFEVNRQPGTLVTWFTATGTVPQSALPPGRFQKVDGRWIRFIALRADGAALSWRVDGLGGINSDFNLRPGPYKDVKISDNMLLLQKLDETWDAFRPPNEGGGIFSPPIPPLQFQRADCGIYFGAGLDFKGEIWAWGQNNLGQLEVPAGPFIDVACLQSTVAGLRADGTVELWGEFPGVIKAPGVVRIKSGTNSLFGQTATGELICLRACNPALLPDSPVLDFDPRDGDSGIAWLMPDGEGFMAPGIMLPGRWQDITTAGGEAMAVVDTDCVGSGFYDRSEIAAGLLSDCNDNLVPDACESGRHIVRAAEWSGDLVGGKPLEVEFEALRPAWRGVRIDVEARGDLLGASRFLTVEIGDSKTSWQLFGTTGKACWQLGRAWDSIVLTPADFDAILGDGDSTTIRFIPSSAVNSSNCEAGGLWIRMEYVADAPFDCTGSGRDDTCDIALGLVEDLDGNGIPDCCELGIPCFPNACPADINGDGVVNGADIAILLGAWGPAGSSGTADLNGDGVVNGADLATMLGSWGQCD